MGTRLSKQTSTEGGEAEAQPLSRNLSTGHPQKNSPDDINIKDRKSGQSD